MAVRQYIGARYVPRFRGDFNITTEYEALDVVDNGEGTSYIAKIPTPPGTPLTNTDYWHLYGSSSGAIIHLQEEIDDINDKLTLASKKVDNVSELAGADLELGDVVAVLGYYAAGDGGDGLFEVRDTASGFYHELSNGLYAVCINEDYKLPRYGGQYVNEMVDNLRQVLTDNNAHHSWKHIILPPANPQHPGCYHFQDGNGRDGYVWLCNNTIVYSEEFAYSINDYYDQIELKVDATSVDAIFKISDASKPEDIYFNNLIVNGWHRNGQTNFPNHAILIEGCARFNVQNLGAGFAKNSLSLIPRDANNPIEINIGYAELGSATEKIINCNSAYGSVMLTADYMRNQNILTGCQYFIYNNGGGFNWKIGKVFLQAASGVTFDNFTTVYWNTNSNSMDLGFDIDVIRCFSSGTGKLIYIHGNRTINRIGSLKSASGTDDSILIDGVSAFLQIGSLHKINNTQNANLETGTYSAIDIQYCDCKITPTGNNIFIGGVCGGTIDSTENFGFAFNSGTSKLALRFNGNNYSIN